MVPPAVTTPEFQVLDGSNPLVRRMRELVRGPDASDGWRKCWNGQVTPWDLGQPTPAVTKLVQSETLIKCGRVLVPGCGAGYDVVEFSTADRYVVGLDVCEAAFKMVKEWSSSSPKANFVEFVEADFFTWVPTEPFDIIFDYTFFCAVHPSLRQAWAQRMDYLLKPEGELITLMYLIQGQEDGPPFNTTESDYENVLTPLGFIITSIEDNHNAVEPRKGGPKSQVRTIER
ncbi:hypothetical protein ACP70R_018482 [Stipagrostis hirtigluma subsp. patula]